MMNLNRKLLILKNILHEVPVNYADSFKEDIRLRLEGYGPERLEELFLCVLHDDESIRNWVDKLTSRIVMHEDEGDVNEIIQDYILCG